MSWPNSQISNGVREEEARGEGWWDRAALGGRIIHYFSIFKEREKKIHANISTSPSFCFAKSFLSKSHFWIRPLLTMSVEVLDKGLFV